MLRIKDILVASAAAVLLLPSVAHAATAVPTLVYNFTYSANQDINAKDSANPAEDWHDCTGGSGCNPANQGSGTSHYEAALDDKGTMTVGILGKQSDGGLIVSISEAGQQTRRAPPATCVVYGNTRVICDPNKTVYTEEYTLLRFLGQNFVERGEYRCKAPLAGRARLADPESHGRLRDRTHDHQRRPDQRDAQDCHARPE